MPRNKDIHKVLVIGSGPIIIGQAAEFDYAGTQACRSLKEEGLEVVLLNSNPATIMTDKDIADRVYIEPLTVEVVEQLILKEKPEAKILLLTTFSDDEYIVKALKCGVKGYLLKQDYASILPAIRAVCTGQTVFGTQIISRLPELLERKSAFDYETYEITEKERAVMKLVADGKSNKEIAGEMFLSEGTIRNYISGILDKLNLRDRTQLAVFYLRNCT